MCYSLLQSVTMCYISVAIYYNVLQCVTVYMVYNSLLRSITLCYNLLQSITMCYNVYSITVCYNVIHSVTICYSLLSEGASLNKGSPYFGGTKRGLIHLMIDQYSIRIHFWKAQNLSLYSLAIGYVNNDMQIPHGFMSKLYCDNKHFFYRSDHNCDKSTLFVYIVTCKLKGRAQ